MRGDFPTSYSTLTVTFVKRALTEVGAVHSSDSLVGGIAEFQDPANLLVPINR